MSWNQGLDPKDLDNYITGHYGEDQFDGEEIEDYDWTKEYPHSVESNEIEDDEERNA